MAKYTIEDTTLTNIAEAIRTKGNTTEALTPIQMPEAINAIQAGGGEGEVKDPYQLRTPEEIYETERPSDWPVLPDPTEDNECYFLIRTKTTGNSFYPGVRGTTKCEWGYIDDNGAFVAVHTYSPTLSSVSSWSEYGLTNQWIKEKMDTYHVLRTTGTDTTAEYSSSSSNGHSAWVIEIKARIKNPTFNSAKNGSSGGSNKIFPGCQFITLYGPQEWTVPAYKFYKANSLRSLMFKDDNPFLKANTTFTSVNNMFYECHSLMTPYYELFKNWTKLTSASGVYNKCYSLEVLDIDLTNNTTMTNMGGYVASNCDNLKRARIKAPYLTAGNVGWSSTPSYKIIVDELDLSSHTAPSQVYYVASYASELLNLKLSTTTMTSSNIAYGGTSYGNLIRRITMAPDATENNVPNGWKLSMKHATFEAMREFIESLPVTTTTKALTIAHYPTLSSGAAQQQIRALAVGKGYTLAFILE